ncbi:DNA-directed RNA polymerase subunit beta [Spiroplasma monobiae]|uniref:DNA-directed RNA polymerase subunit beta n=2 Tax=Spiroplasma monobiae (strain ATCC 33825 / MQ-1) TaxID=2136 RepID=A0A2K9LTE4_SPISQ|nr:DNA-directed RNA polymerase subunit beta [Spiroplasma monobiae]AUM62297.1 DNA-directed RNA polymerase subunit beta [Spiroplasma monobiae MQ-1]
MKYKIKKINALVERRDYAKVSGDLELPNLIELQTDTFEWFKQKGINEVFEEVFPVVSADGDIVLSMTDWEFREPRLSITKAKEESKIFEAPIYSNLSLTIHMEDVEVFKEEISGSMETFLKGWLQEKLESTGVEFKDSKGSLYFFEFKGKTGEKDTIQIEIKDEKDEFYLANIDIYKTGEVFFGEFPLMTDRGTFVINGSEKVVVSQLVRSPGSYFKEEMNRKNGEMIYYADIIPSRGTWLEFELDSKKALDNKVTNVFYVKIDKSRKTTATSLLTAFKMQKEEILDLFDNNEVISSSYELDTLTGDIEIDYENQVQEIYKKIRQGETATADGASKYLYGLLFDKRKYDLTKAGRFKLQQKLSVKNRLIGRVLAEDIIDVKGKVAFAKGTEITKDIFDDLDKVLEAGAMVQKINFNDAITSGNEIQKVKVFKDNDLRNETATIIGITKTSSDEFVNLPDIIATISYAINLMDGIGEIDDIDHLGNRRVRTVGELLQNQFRIGMMRIEKNVREKLATSNPFKMKPSSIINNKPLTAIIGEFFNLSQLSQFMDQTNPLAELTNKRRLTALGPGGLSRDRAALEVRDVHPSHYGRICPIETPEGPNIGLINNLSTYAKINEYGFIETPYRKVKNTKVISGEYEYLTADKEKDYVVAQANINLAEDGTILDEQVVARYRGDDIMVSPEDVDYVDVSPKQIVSIATSCIPFLENDDANRALMGANMQRQAVPLINPESPIVGTGVEHEAARDSGDAIVATADGIVKYVDSKRVTIEQKDGIKTYDLNDFSRSNNGTAITHLPIVKLGDKVKARDILADGPSMEKGELALGQNVVVAFTTWNGYNYEDAVIVSERIVIDDRFTSIHIDEYTIERRQTKQGPEEITRDIPNISEVSKKYLDEDGIVAIGSEVKVGDILVGKVTPKSQTQLSPEDKLLHAIFGEKSRNVKDNSLRVPNGGEGIVKSIKRFSRADGHDLPADILEIIKVYIVQKRKIQEGDKMAGRHGNKGVISKILPVEDMPHMEDGTPVDIMLNPQGVPSRMNIGQVLEIHLGMAAKKLGIKVNTPVFEGVKEQELQDIMEEAGMDNYGKVTLVDGRTGEAFDKPISVGVMYMLKLSHMVDDKLHTRNIGPYSLITQQPLGGKAQNGGQRFGEMEVWALEAYGAAYTLREILTIKSDDIKGRIKTYESIVRSKPIPKPGIPESFNVLTKEIMGLGFDMHMIDEEGNKVQINAYDDDDEFEIDTELLDGDSSFNDADIKDYVETSEDDEITFEEESIEE